MTDPAFKQTFILMVMTIGLALAAWMIAFVIVSLLSEVNRHFGILYQTMNESTFWLIAIALVLLMAACLWGGVYEAVQLIKEMQ